MPVEIFWYGQSCFRLRSREATVVTDPYADDIGYTLPNLRADIVTVSHAHRDHANYQAIKGKPYVISGPGEYEINGVFVTGLSAYHDQQLGKERGKSTMYWIEFDDLTVCHLGDLGHVPTQSQVDELTDIEVLLIPVGGGPTINAAEAAEVVSLLEPKVVIPMHYRTPDLKFELEGVDKFLKAMGSEKTEPMESFRASRDVLPEETQVVLLSYKH